MTDFGPLVGTWETEATHPAYPGLVVPGRTTFEWLAGEKFLIQRASTTHPDFPDSISVIGEDSMHYFDSRGVHRIYQISLSGSELTIRRNHPDFSQHFTGRIAGDMIAGLWQLSRDGSTWDDDLAVTWRKRA
jgi:hypothetical protein